MASLIEVIAALCSSNGIDEEKKEELRKEFEAEMKEKYNRGTVITAMAEKGWTSYEMGRVLEEIENCEQAEAAVGLIKSGNNYTSYDIARIIRSI